MKKSLILLLFFSSLFANRDRFLVYAGLNTFPSIGVGYRYYSQSEKIGVEGDVSVGYVVFGQNLQTSLRLLIQQSVTGPYCSAGLGYGKFTAVGFPFPDLDRFNGKSLIIPFAFGYQFRKAFIDIGVTFAPHIEQKIYPTLRFGGSF